MPFLCSIFNAVCGQSSFLHLEYCVVLKHHKQYPLFLFWFFLFFFVIWSNLSSGVCSAMCFNCFWTCIAACAMQKTCIPWILQPSYGFNLMQHFYCKCRSHFLASQSSGHASVFMNGSLLMNWFYVCLFSFWHVSFLSITTSLTISSSCNPRKGNSFCRSFHSWFSDSGLILIHYCLQETRYIPSERTRIKSSSWGFRRWVLNNAEHIWPEQEANGGMLLYCWRLSEDRSLFNRTWMYVWAWKRACCLNMVLHRHLQ